MLLCADGDIECLPMLTALPCRQELAVEDNGHDS